MGEEESPIGYDRFAYANARIIEKIEKMQILLCTPLYGEEGYVLNPSPYLHEVVKLSDFLCTKI